MRNLLATAVAIAPLLAATGAQAEIVISNSRTTPIQTSNATGSAADNIRIASGGSVLVNTGVAVTLDSNNSIDLDSGGFVTMDKAASGATAILVQGGNTGSVTIGGGITVNDTLESADLKDTDNDGDLDGDFVEGTGRYGVRFTGADAFIGDLVVESSGSVRVEGNQSYGISIESALNGSLRQLGSVSVVGNDSYAVRVTGDISGDVVVAGSVSATGGNSAGVSLEGDIAGGLTIQSSVTTTGYRYTTSPMERPETGASDSVLYRDELDADDLLQGGPAFVVAGNVANGVVLDIAPSYGSGGIDGDSDGDGVKNGDEDDDGDGTKNREDSDRDGDGIADAGESAASLVSLGGAPALLIGSTSSSVTLGVAGTGDNAYGLINRGSLSGSGVYDDIDAHALQLGVENGAAVQIDGGVINQGTIAATGVKADATAIWATNALTTPEINNSGFIQSVVTSDENDSSTTILIDNGANVSTIRNSGNISASFFGNHGEAVAVRDLSGSVSEFSNSGSIAARFTANPSDETDVDGSSVALDFSVNTSGVLIRQFGVVAAEDEDITDTDGDGVADPAEPSITGDIRLGSGADVVNIENGAIIGDISFGDGADTLNISGTALVVGGITDTDGQLDIEVADGSLIATQPTSTTISNLVVGSEGTLALTANPEAGTNGGFDVTGTATIAEGAQLGVRFDSLLQEPGRFSLIRAGTLNAGTIDTDFLSSNSPYLYMVTAGVDQAAGELYVDARRRTADEVGMIQTEAQAFDAIYEALGSNETLSALFLNQTDRDGFINAYEQMLPDHSGGPLMSLSSGVDAVTRALTGRNASAKPGETSAWLQEINFYADKDKTESYGFRSEGFGVAGGVEKGTSLGALGVSVAFTSSDIEDPEAEAEEVLSANLLELGLYWRAQGQYWTTWARAAGGYASFSADRSLVADGVYLNNTSDWHGWTAAAAGGVSYERNFGRLSVRPELYAEYFHLSEGARSETGGGDGFDLDIDERDSHIFSAVAAMNIGYGFGRNGWLRPELRIGYRQNLSVDAGETIARFASGGPDFILTPDAIEGGGPILGFRLNFGNELGMLSLTGDAEMLEDYIRYSLLLRASFRF